VTSQQFACRGTVCERVPCATLRFLLPTVKGCLCWWGNRCELCLINAPSRLFYADLPFWEPSYTGFGLSHKWFQEILRFSYKYNTLRFLSLVFQCGISSVKLKYSLLINHFRLITYTSYFYSQILINNHSNIYQLIYDHEFILFDLFIIYFWNFTHGVLGMHLASIPR
jgi:hypothetical protein